MYRVAQAKNSSLKLSSTSVLIEVSQASHPGADAKGAGLGFVVNKS